MRLPRSAAVGTVRRMDSIVMKRSLSLHERDLEQLGRLRDSGPHRDALMALTGEDPTNLSEAALLRAVMDIGFRAVREQVELAGYAAIAAHDDLTLSERRIVARRLRPSAQA